MVVGWGPLTQDMGSKEARIPRWDVLAGPSVTEAEQPTDTTIGPDCGGLGRVLSEWRGPRPPGGKICSDKTSRRAGRDNQVIRRGQQTVQEGRTDRKAWAAEQLRGFRRHAKGPIILHYFSLVSKSIQAKPVPEAGQGGPQFRAAGRGGTTQADFRSGPNRATPPVVSPGWALLFDLHLLLTHASPKSQPQ